MKWYRVLIITLWFVLGSRVEAQESQSSKSVFPRGISFAYKYGSYAVTDEYISKEKYSGVLPGFSASWSRFHDKYGYRLRLEYGSSSEIKNHNVSTTIYQFVLDHGFLYPFKQTQIFKKDVYFYLGPATELYFFYNNQNIAVSGFDYAQSFAMLFSAAIQLEGICPIHETLQIESSLGLSMLSLGFRMVDSEEEDVSPARLLTLFSGTNAGFGLGLRYIPTHKLSLKLAYKLQITRISSWDPLLAASDNFVLFMTYHF